MKQIYMIKLVFMQTIYIICYFDVCKAFDSVEKKILPLHSTLNLFVFVCRLSNPRCSCFLLLVLNSVLFLRPLPSISIPTIHSKLKAIKNKIITEEDIKIAGREFLKKGVKNKDSTVKECIL